MEPKSPSKEACGDSVRSLGGLLYADKSRSRTPEADWVALVHAMAGGDQLALRGLFERSHRIVYTLALRISGSRETAEELTVDVFHDVWRKASSYDANTGTVVAWIMNQTRSRAIDRVRHDTRKKRTNGQQAVDPSEEPLTDALEDLHRFQQRGALKQALAALPSDERQAIETAFYSGMTYAEVAVRLNTPVGTVKTRIRSGLAKLREALRDNEL